MSDIIFSATVKMTVEPSHSRWAARIPGAGVLAYGATKADATEAAKTAFHNAMAITYVHHGITGLRAYLDRNTTHYSSLEPLEAAANLKLPGVKVEVAA